MATNERLATRHRIPKLSDKPEPGTGRYYASYRSSNGTARRQRFVRDRIESQQMYRRWVIEQYDDHADIVIRDGSGFKDDVERTLPYIANAFVQHNEGSVRTDGATRTKGTISLRVFDDNRRQVVNILTWCQERFGDRVKRESFRDLLSETDYEAMMMAFARRLSPSQVNKHRQRFWLLVNFAKRRPFQVRLSFGPDDVQHFGGTEVKRSRSLPTVAMVRTVLDAARSSLRTAPMAGASLKAGTTTKTPSSTSAGVGLDDGMLSGRSGDTHRPTWHRNVRLPGADHTGRRPQVPTDRKGKTVSGRGLSR